MGLLRRPGSAPEATYARVLDGRHLWLAVRGADALALRHPDRGDVEIPVATEGDLVTAVFPLDAVFDDDAPTLDLVLVGGTGRRAVPAAHADEVVAGPLRLHHRGWQVLDVDGQVVVRRHDPASTIEVEAITTSEQGVVVHVQTLTELAELHVGGEVVAELPVSDGAVGLAELPLLPPGATASLRCGGIDVVRSRNLLTRPHVSVALPPMPEPDVELRWLRDGRLAVHRKAAP